jgi:hypothetical protein
VPVLSAVSAMVTRTLGGRALVATDLLGRVAQTRLVPDSDERWRVSILAVGCAINLVTEILNAFLSLL